MSQTDNMPRSKILNAQKNDFAAFMHLKLEDLRKWKKARQGLDYRILNKIMTSVRWLISKVFT